MARVCAPGCAGALGRVPERSRDEPSPALDQRDDRASRSESLYRANALFFGGGEIHMNKASVRFVLVLGMCLCLAALLGSRVSAQSTFGSISGTVMDASGSAVPDAKVTLVSAATAARQTVTTSSDGL